jgi:thiamine-phosphate pyrophosphorylase
MRPLPRLHAITDRNILALGDFASRAASLATTGPAIALHARDRGGSGARLTALARTLVHLAGPLEASVFANGRADVAAAVALQGLQLGQGDLAPADVRRAFGTTWAGWIGVSVHSIAEAEAAITEGADYVLVGSVYETPTHPGHAPAGLALVREVAARGKPVIAIGGITAERAAAVRDAGAYGIAAIRALWLAEDPGQAALTLLAPWTEAA